MTTSRSSLLAHIQQCQSQASDPRAHVVVHASAGSGKTKVLVDRLLRLALSGVSLESVLCLTFTKAAAKEMQDRLATKAAAWLQLSPAKLAEALAELGISGEAATHRARGLYEVILSRGHRFQITTLHSFCQSLLAAFPLEAGINPHFSVLETGEAQNLLQQAIETIFLAPPLAPHLQTVFSHVSPEKLMGFIMGLSPEKRDALSKAQPEPPVPTPLYAACAPEDPAGLLAISHILQQGTDKDKARGKALQAGLDAACWQGEAIITAPLNLCTSQYRDVFLTQSNSPRKSLLNAALKAKYPEYHNLMQAEADRLKTLTDARHTYEAACTQYALLTLLTAVIEGYTERKKAGGFLDYGDLILKTAHFLQTERAPGWIGYKIGMMIQHILVDESQDMSALQWTVVGHLWAAFFDEAADADSSHHAALPTVFLVGDKKQSIYGFQGASPALFSKIGEDIARRADHQRALLNAVSLTVSFRSAPLVLSAVDRVFADAELRDGLMEESIVHHPYRGNDTPDDADTGFQQNHEMGSFQIWPLIAPPPLDDGDSPDPGALTPDALSIDTSDDLSGETASESAALAFATKVKHLLETHHIFRHNRPAQPKDIMILFRQRAPWMAAVIQALKKLEQPVVEEDRLCLQNNPLIQWICSICLYSLNPDHLSRSRGILERIFHSNGPFPLSLPQIQTLLAGKKAVYDMLKQHQAGVPIVEFFHDITRLARSSRITTFVLLLMERARALSPQCGLFSHHQAFEVLLAMAAGQERKNTAYTLREFLTWLGSQNQSIKADVLQDKSPHAPGEIFCTTVHGAKGLQAPIVILADTTRTPAAPKGLFWPETRLKTSDLPWILPPLKNRPDKLIALAEAEQAAAEAEASRLLYVAMTRAEDHLVIAGFQPKNRLHEKSWRAQITRCFENDFAGDVEQHLMIGTTGENRAPGDIPLPRTTDTALPPWPIMASTRNLERLGRKISTPWKQSSHVHPPLFHEDAPDQKQDDAPEAQAAEKQTIVHDTNLPGTPAFIATQKGIFAHQLLQYWHPDPACFARDIGAVSALFKATLSDAIQAPIIQMIHDFTQNPEFAWVFHPESQAEVPLCGIWKGQRYVGRLDRWTPYKDGYAVIEFKTGAVPAWDQWHQQNACYTALLNSQNRGKEPVRGAVIWVPHQTLQWSDEV